MRCSVGLLLDGQSGRGIKGIVPVMLVGKGCLDAQCLMSIPLISSSCVQFAEAIAADEEYEAETSGFQGLLLLFLVCFCCRCHPVHIHPLV